MIRDRVWPHNPEESVFTVDKAMPEFHQLFHFQNHYAAEAHIHDRSRWLPIEPLEAAPVLFPEAVRGTASENQIACRDLGPEVCVEGTHRVNVRAVGPDPTEYRLIEGLEGVEYETSGSSGLAGLVYDVSKERVREVGDLAVAREVSAPDEAFHAGDARDEPIHIFFTFNMEVV